MATEHDKAILSAIFNPHLPSTHDGEDDVTDISQDGEEEMDPSLRESRQLETTAVNLAESGDMVDSIQLLTESIEICPRNASAFNNRAQVHRLNNDTEAAIRDLDEAIKLSEGRGPVARQAFCQRGLVRHYQGQNDLAREDFQAASDLGSPFAKSALVRFNPYAALCSQMLEEIFQKLQF